MEQGILGFGVYYGRFGRPVGIHGFVGIIQRMKVMSNEMYKLLRNLHPSLEKIAIPGIMGSLVDSHRGLLGSFISRDHGAFF